MALQAKPKAEKDRSERWLLTYADLLAQVSEPLKSLPNPLQIVSNTDELGPQSTNSQYPNNWLLGNARSYVVLRALVDGNRFPEDRLSLWNKAQYSPMFPNDSPE